MSKRELRFGAFELDPASGELRKHGIRIKLQDQPLKILIALIERPGEIVTREHLRALLWGSGTFVDYEHGLSAAVNRLREALADSPENPRYVETMARRGYRFIAPVAVPSEPVPPPAKSPSRHNARLVWKVAALLAAVSGGVWLMSNRIFPPDPKVVQLTAFAGSESHPAFSPDGREIAFDWDGETQDNFDVYVKLVGDSPALRLTKDPGFDGFPAWSPDGNRIAFVSLRNAGGIYLVSPLGGSEQKLTDLPTLSRVSWSPDGKYLVAAKRHQEDKEEDGDGSLFMVPAEPGRTPSLVLKPPHGSWYVHPAFAPDGRSLAFASCEGSAMAPSCRLMIAGVEQGPALLDHVRQVTEPSMLNIGLAWTPDASSLIFSTLRSGGTRAYLWRIGVRAGAKPERLDLAGPAAFYPAVDWRGRRLAYSQDAMLADCDIYRVEPGIKPAPLLTSSARDSNPQYSPDGRQIAFESGRATGNYSEIWVANADGTGPHQVTKLGHAQSGTPRWSPDGHLLAFDTYADNGHFEVWVVESIDGVPRQLAKGPGDNVIPSWSHDGKSVYFASKRSGRFEIWRVPAAGGDAVQITRDGGLVAFESSDGRFLYYVCSDSGAGLYAKRLPDGEEKQLFGDEIAARGFVVFSDGVYYLHPAGRPEFEIRFYGFARGASRVVARLEGGLADGLTVSPDRKTFLYSKSFPKGKDLMLLENFR